ncbi:Flp pilus assembly protein CpaB [Bordetella petrii]|uniref:Flp pilus assembly protein CpaB n=1 Tax=Bordetella petrii TaxID=94624 RepID=UPI001E4F2939|nr:Flp pilus assembly protein CpaB [Bordetella petrii]MCD0501638.1 Flp pilus assembly protein CpaB [Bordetella petrii]
MRNRIRPYLLKARPFAVYAFALGAGLLAAWAAREHIQGRVREIERQAEVPVAAKLVAANDLPAGTRLQLDHLAVRDIPLQWVSKGMLDPDAADQAVGSVLAADLLQGDALLGVLLTPAAPPPPLSDLVSAGRRAVTLPAGEITAASGVLHPEDVVDIYVSFNHRGHHLTAPLLQGVRVLAMGGDAQAVSSITLDTSAEDAVKLVAARHAGTLTAMLRHRSDAAGPVPAASGDLAALMGLDADDLPRHPAVSILYGDRLDGDVPAPALEDSAVAEGRRP